MFKVRHPTIACGFGVEGQKVCPVPSPEKLGCGPKSSRGQEATPEFLMTFAGGL
jgi:hypothetical protein